MHVMRLACGLVALPLATACAPAVLTQSVPVSTSPGGARVLADGTPACETPCTVALARTQDHILTFRKDGYRQQDVIVKRQYQTEKVLLDAINSGYSTGSFFKNPAWGLDSGVQSMHEQEATGRAYVLIPSAISLTLVPTGGFPFRPSPADTAPSEDGASPLDVMDDADEQMLENVLETLPSRRTTVWTNQGTGISFAASPEPAQTQQESIVRYVTVGASQGDRKIIGRYPAWRVGRGEWQIGLPPAIAQPPASAPGGAGRETVRALGEAPWVGAGGSVTKTTTRTSGSASSGVDPGVAASIFNALGNLGSSK